MLLFLLERSLCWSNCEIIVEVEEVEKERSCGWGMFVSWLFCCNSLVVANVFKSAKEAEKDGYDDCEGSEDRSDVVEEKKLGEKEVCEGWTRAKIKSYLKFIKKNFLLKNLKKTQKT